MIHINIDMARKRKKNAEGRRATGASERGNATSSRIGKERLRKGAILFCPPVFISDTRM